MTFPRLVALIELEKFQVDEVGFANSPYVFDFDITLPRLSQKTIRLVSWRRKTNKKEHDQARNKTKRNTPKIISHRVISNRRKNRE
jgi:hypothetical protein